MNTVNLKLKLISLLFLSFLAISQPGITTIDSIKFENNHLKLKDTSDEWKKVQEEYSDKRIEKITVYGNINSPIDFFLEDNQIFWLANRKELKELILLNTRFNEVLVSLAYELQDTFISRIEIVTSNDIFDSEDESARIEKGLEELRLEESELFDLIYIEKAEEIAPLVLALKENGFELVNTNSCSELKFVKSELDEKNFKKIVLVTL